METRLTLIHAMSPVYAGTGQSVGAIDLPIARERPTGIPLIPGSSIKGALRARSNGKDPQMTRDVFGPTENSSEHAGSVQFSDAHLLLLPVRSIRGTFAWVTSRYLIRKFARLAKEAGETFGDLPGSPSEAGCLVTDETLTVMVGPSRKVVFEDLDFTVETDEGDLLKSFVKKLGPLLFPGDPKETQPWQDALSDHICLIHDDMMSFLLETATEVNAHVRLDNMTKTVQRGALWYQESLPAESVLAGIVVASDVKRTQRTAKDLLAHVSSLTNGLVQLGGKATTGQGSCFVRLGGQL